MEEQLISYKTAKLAKEKGFNEFCDNAYWNDSSIALMEKDIVEQYKNSDYSITAPTQSLLQKWLRDVHFIHINIGVTSGGDGEEIPKWYYSYVSRFDDCLADEAIGCSDDTIFTSYEDALEEALKTTLDLI